MVLPAFLLKEKIVDVTQLRHNPEKSLKGFVRLVSEKHGLKTSGFFFDKEAFVNFLEALEYSSKEFWNEIEKSRKSGRVSSKEIEHRLGIK